MTWNWQRPEWPDFAWDQAELDAFEKQFLLQSGELVGALRHIGSDDQDALRIDLISDEAVKPPRSRAKSLIGTAYNPRCGINSGWTR